MAKDSIQPNDDVYDERWLDPNYVRIEGTEDGPGDYAKGERVPRGAKRMGRKPKAALEGGDAAGTYDVKH